jgi:hypothetical protein
LHDSCFVDAGNAYVFENLVIDLTRAPWITMSLLPLSSGQNADAWGSFAASGLKVKSTQVLVK